MSTGSVPLDELPRDGEIHVLCVDDDPAMLDVTAAWLERESDRLVTTTVPTVDAALRRLETVPVDCIVSDYQMPGTDGLAFLDSVRGRYGDLPFVLFTARGSEDIASDAISEGVTEYLQKRSGVDQYALLANRIEHAVEAHRAKAALEESERMLTTLVSNVPGMVYRCLNDPDWTMEFVSEGSLSVTGYDPEALVSGTISYGEDVVHPDDQDSVWEAVQTSLAADEPFELRYRILTRDDEVRWVYEQGSGVVEDGELVALEGVIIDVTDLREGERELERQNERLERFARVVSHDLRSPLVVAQGSLDLARTSGDDDDFDRASAALRRMDALIDDLLTLARDDQPVDVTPDIRLADVVDSVWNTVPSNGTAFECSLGDFRVAADEARLHQLLQNLFSNAVEHGGERAVRDDGASDTGGDGSLKIHVGRLADDAGFFVADDGSGLPTDDTESLFEHGYSTSETGTGFGLAIVRSIADAHDWEVTAVPSADGGARFEVRFERERTTAAAMAETPTAANPARRADDEASNESNRQRPA